MQEVEEWTPIYPQIIADKKYLDYLYDSGVRKALSDIAIQLTEHEGPVSPERFAKFVGGCFGLERVVTSRVTAINEIPFPSQERDDEGFLFPYGKTPLTFELWRRGTEASLRKIQDISISEISNAMKAICEVAHGVRPEQLNKEVSRLFGVTKVSATVNQRLDIALRFGLANGRLVKNGDYIQAV